MIQAGRTGQRDRPDVGGICILAMWDHIPRIRAQRLAPRWELGFYQAEHGLYIQGFYYSPRGVSEFCFTQ